MLRKIFILIFCLSSIYGISQTPSLPPNHFYRYYGVENGLSNSSVYGIYQDNNNLIWLSTVGAGVDVFNGHEFINISKGNGLPSNMVHQVIQDSKNNYWISTDNGLVKRGISKNKVFSTSEGLKSSNTWCSLFVGENEQWVATDSGLAIIKNEKVIIPDFSKQIGYSKIFSLYKDSKQRIWIGSQLNGIFLFENNELKEITDTGGYTVKDVRNINEDNDGIIYFSGTKGIYSYADGTLKKNVADFPVTSSSFNKQMFFSSYYGDIFLYTKAKNVEYVYKLPSGGIRSILFDKEENLWVGTENGIFQYSKNPFYNWNTNQGLLDKSVFAICPGYKPNEFWIGLSNNGACYMVVDSNNHTSISNHVNIDYIGNYEKKEELLNPKKKPDWNKLKGLIGSYIITINKDSKNRTWFGTLTGITIFNHTDSSYLHISDNRTLALKKCRVYPPDKFNKIIFHLSKDSEGKMWVSTLKGVYIFDDTTLIEKPEPLNALNQSSIYYVLHDKNDIKWICTDKGLYQFNFKTNKLIHFTAKEGFVDGIVSAIIKDNKNNYWLATKEGIFFYDGKKFKNFSKNDGLNSDNIFSIAMDNHGKFIIAGTNKGLNKIDLDMFYKKDILKVKWYSVNDGFMGQDCNRNAIYVDNQNNFYIGTVDGVTIYKSYEDDINHIKPKILIKNILFNFKEFDWSPYCDSINAETKLPIKLDLPYNKNHLTFQFTAVSFKNPERVQYQFKLVGLDDNWSPVMNKNEADFPSLPPGKYKFLLRAANEDGLWCDPIEYDFVISPPFYKTWWFITIVIIIIIISIVFYIKYREKALIKEKQRLETIVKERTAEVVQQKEIVEQKNKDITDSINYARNIQEALLPDMEEVKQLFPDSFIFYAPRDIVSGDFYWISHKNNRTFLAIADCTGHGVPGAFMSMLGITFLDEIVSNDPNIQANEVLNHLRNEIIVSLKQNEKESTSKDGMDIVFIIHDQLNHTIQYAGANNPLYILKCKNKETDEWDIEEIKADKMPIGQHISSDPFKNHIINIDQDMTLYMFSDGYADQFGGPKGKKFKYQSIKNLILEHHKIPAAQQGHLFRQTFFEWKGNYEQVDDVMLCGIKFKAPQA